MMTNMRCVSGIVFGGLTVRSQRRRPWSLCFYP